MPTTSFKTWQSLYLCAELNGTVVADRPEAGSWEQFTPVTQPDGTLAFRSEHGRYLCAEPDYTVTCDRQDIGPWECWTAERLRPYLYALKSHHGRYLCAEPDHTVRADREAIGPWETFETTLTEPEAPIIGSPGPGVLVGTIHADWHQGVRDATGHVLPILCHAGDLLSRYYRDQATTRRHLDDIATAGYHGVRVWTILVGSYWQGFTGEISPDTPGYWETVAKFAEELRARQLRWLVSQGDLMRWARTTALRQAFMRQLAEMLRLHGGTEELIFGIDACNEGGNNGEGDTVALKRTLDAFTAVLPVPFKTLTSTQEKTANIYVYGDCLRDIHSIRSAWPQPGRYVFNVGYEAGKTYTSQSEGPGQGAQEYAGDRRIGHHVSATDRPDQWNDAHPEIVGVMAALHAIGKAQYVYFCSPGVISDEPFTNYLSFRQMPQLYAKLPRDVQSWEPFHGGEGRSFSPDRVLAVPTNNDLQVRCDHAKSGSRRLCVAYGPEGTYQLRVVNTFRGTLLRWAASGAVVIEAVQWPRDSTVTLSWRYGCVLVGEVS